jgi:hypothetical protein
LSLARNALTRIEGLDAVGGTLEQLWLSYNQIVKLGGLEPCAKLRVLYLANNGIRDFKELESIPSTVEVRRARAARRRSRSDSTVNAHRRARQAGAVSFRQPAAGGCRQDGRPHVRHRLHLPHRGAPQAARPEKAGRGCSGRG